MPGLSRVVSTIMLAACVGCGVAPGPSDLTVTDARDAMTRDAAPDTPGAPDAMPADAVTDAVPERPLPPHREAAIACEQALEPRADATCSASEEPAGGQTDECVMDTDCVGEGARCLAAWAGIGTTVCQCFEPQCHQDEDCGSNGVCVCGATRTGLGCGGGFGVECHHRCVYAQCRVDADCGPGGLCSPSPDPCGWGIGLFACHQVATDECLTYQDCRQGEQCVFVSGQGWACRLGEMCD
jgi:hypothetical protein